MSGEREISKIEKLAEKKKSDKIEKYLNDKDIEVVKAAIAALGRIQDEKADNLLSGLIDDQDPEVRKAAIKAFASIGSEYAKTLLQHLVATETNAEVKEVAVEVLHNFKKK